MDKYIHQLNEMYNNGEISLREKTRLYEEYENSGQMDSQVSSKIKVSSKSEVLAKSEVSTNEEISDRQLQERILKTLKLNQIDNRSIKKWVTFWSWFTIITMVIYIIVLLSSL